MNNPRLFSNYLQYQHTGKPLVFRVDLHVISGCNFRCIMCDNWKNEIEVHFSDREILDIIRTLYTEYRCCHIRFHGQEPTLYAWLDRAVAFAKRLGIKVGIKTNGWLMSDMRLAKLLRYGLDEIYLSIDGPNAEIHDHIRGRPGSFARNIRILALAKKLSPTVRTHINSVVMHENARALPEMVDLGKQYGVDRVSFVFLNDKNRQDIDMLCLSEDEMIDFFHGGFESILERSIDQGIAVDFSPSLSRLVGLPPKEILSRLRADFSSFRNEISAFSRGEYGKYFYDRYGCHGPLDHASINFTGDMYGCCVVERSSENAVGNILREPVSSLWYSRRYSEYRSTSDTSCAYATFCGSNFSSRKSLSDSIYHAEGRSYSWDHPMQYYRYLHRVYEDGEAIGRIRTQKLFRLIRDHYEYNPIYRSLLEASGISWADLEIETDYRLLLSRLPILDREDIRAMLDGIPGDRLDPTLIDSGRTSGSSSAPLEYYFPRNFDRFVKQVFVYARQSGHVFSDSCFWLAPRNCNFRRIGDEPGYVRKQYIPLPNSFDLSDRAYFESVSALFSGHPDIASIHTDPLHLLLIIRWFLKHGLPLPRLRYIFLTYSFASRGLKRFLNSTLGAEIFDNYGCSEIGPIAGEVNGRRKILSESVIVESIDGEIVLTDLDNSITPFIRYKNGDVGEIRNDELVLHGRHNVRIGGMFVEEFDTILFESFPEIVAYQFSGDRFIYDGDPQDIDRIARLLQDVGVGTYRVTIADTSFFSLSDCWKFPVFVE